MKRILIIEDDDVIRMGLNYYLKQESFDTLESSNARDALSILKENTEIILCLLDVNLPDQNGFSLFQEIRTFSKVPIIFLTADDIETSIVMGLDMGADDYITKPFKARELMSRIRNVLRRYEASSGDSVIEYGGITLDTRQAKVFKGGKDVMLTALEYKIILNFFLNPNIVFTREKVLSNIWDVNEEYVNDNTLTVYIKRIREKIEDDPSNPKIIQTVRGIGYQLGVRDD
ncbi:MAG: response regulator transcription factor [Bacilli bacterium]|nr:response regulator transcription factor [Bacilli bacterium]